ncbi:hypothetical protein FNV43_RR00781 [Rhamnella rubrinervis]|uniref:Uncharacterized protein n=1 Tax=Rhamnella rubrinervis TaxID=2594499 RepID=A0A8K0HRA6_9ROSA|nr:hypothetical protein FNV43_RR00781 [Rhamnella rubrinervis]
MSDQQAYEFDYMAQEGEMDHSIDEMDEENSGSDEVFDEYKMDQWIFEFEQHTKVSDTSSSQARKGKDIQGIPWDRLNITREKYRLTRLEQYRNYENIPLSGEAVDKECKQMEKGDNYYEFFHNTRLVKPTILHFQKHAGRLLEGFSQTQISTLAVKDNFMVVGGFRGELICKHTSISPDRRLVAVVGDHIDGQLVDSQSGKTVASVFGHLDYSFGSAWHPDGRTFSTGNQDKTCRVWDIRNLSGPGRNLKGNLGTARSIRFSADGHFMVVAEPADFVHIYSTKVDYKKRQEIDFFGEISGVSLSPDDESLYIGVCDQIYGSLLQYN